MAENLCPIRARLAEGWRQTRFCGFLALGTGERHAATSSGGSCNFPGSARLPGSKAYSKAMRGSEWSTPARVRWHEVS